MTAPRCRHVCACGAVLVCAEPDKCAAGKHWQCPTCEQQAQDEFWIQQQYASRTKESHADVRISR